MTTRPWVPVLEPKHHARVRSLADEIARNLRSSAMTDDITLASGASGQAVFFAELSAALDNAEHLDQACRALDHVLSVFERVVLNETLAYGISGVAWSVDFVERRAVEDDRPDRTEEAEAFLTRRLDLNPTGPLGLLDGLCGTAVYLTARLPRRRAKAGLETLVTRLVELSDLPENNWSTWWSAPGTRAGAPPGKPRHGHYDLTAGSGVPGIAAVLFDARQANVCDRLIGRLFDRCLTWLQGNQIGASLPAFAGPAIHAGARAEGWAESTAAVLAMLLPGATALHREDFVADGIRWTLAEATEFERRRGLAGRRETGLLRGAPGLAHVYNRIYQFTLDTAFRELAVKWLIHTLETAESQLRGCRAPDGYGLLSGLCGAGLALLAGINRREPRWDSVLLLSSGQDRAPTREEPCTT